MKRERDVEVVARDDDDDDDDPKLTGDPFLSLSFFLFCRCCCVQVETYAADGFDTLEQCIRTQMMEGPLGNRAHHERIQKGLDALYQHAQRNITKHFSQFSSRASRRCFTVPHEIVKLPSDFSEKTMHTVERLPACSVEEEEALDERLENLRRRIAKSRAVTMRSKSELTGLAKEIEMHGDLTKKLGEVPEVALREKNENAWEGAKACRSVVETAKRLQPLLHQAERIAETGAFLNSSDAMNSKDEMRRDAVSAAREAMRNCFVKGGSLEALRQINAKLLNTSTTIAPPQTGNEEDAMVV